MGAGHLRTTRNVASNALCASVWGRDARALLKQPKARNTGDEGERCSLFHTDRAATRRDRGGRIRTWRISQQTESNVAFEQGSLALEEVSHSASGEASFPWG